jgi:hypothetical protein
VSDVAEEVEVFGLRMGRFRAVDTSSDADGIISSLSGGRDKVRFRITYAGELKASGKKPRREEKDAVRSYISPQLIELSDKHPVFRGYGLVADSPEVGLPWGREADARMPIGPTPPPSAVRVVKGVNEVYGALWDVVKVNGRNYRPLVRSSLALTCGLDILFMRKDGPGPLMAEGGDLDNRIKTLFDGLRVPLPHEVEQPTTESDAVTFCLLEDDALVTDFAVRTDRLLTHPGAGESEVLLVIDVVVNVSHLTSLNLGFLSE